MTLTRQETRVAAELVTGATNAQIGARLCITEDTVKCHVKAILRKTGSRTRTEAAALLRSTDGQQRAEILAPFAALIDAAPHRLDCRYAIAGIGERVLVDLEELRAAMTQAEAV